MQAKIGQRLFIGLRPEHNAREFAFDIAQWRAQWPETTAINVIVQRQGDKTAYPAISRMEGDTVIWTVTRYDTERPGVGSMWVEFSKGDKLLGLTPATLITVGSGPEMIGGDTPASDTPPWIQRVLDAAANMQPGTGGGTPGADGGYYTPSVDQDTGKLSWQGSKPGMPDVPDSNIKGPQGAKGESGVRVSKTEPTDPDVMVWINEDGEAGPTIETDTTLSKAGFAADAKVTGERLASLSEDKADKPKPYELIETIVCDGTYGNIKRAGLALSHAKILIHIKEAEAAANLVVEINNGTGMFGYSLITNGINTGERWTHVYAVSDGKNAYSIHTAVASTPYGAGALYKTAGKQDASTPINLIKIYAGGSKMLPAGSTIKILGVRANV